MPDVMNKTVDIASLKQLTHSLINEALVETRRKRPNSPTGREPHFRAAEYLLLEAQDYVDGSWEMLTIGNVRAALSLSRWVLEAALNLWWVVSDESKTEQRLADLAGEALRQHANLCDGLIELWPDQADAIRKRANGARQTRNKLGSERLDPLDRRVQDGKPLDEVEWLDPYILYRVCCAAAHPSLRLWERFETIGQATVSSEPSNNTVLTFDMAAWMAAASPLHLVTFACCMTETGDTDKLKEWWNEKAVPLLG